MTYTKSRKYIISLSNVYFSQLQFYVCRCMLGHNGKCISHCAVIQHVRNPQCYRHIHGARKKSVQPAETPVQKQPAFLSCTHSDSSSRPRRNHSPPGPYFVAWPFHICRQQQFFVQKNFPHFLELLARLGILVVASQIFIAVPSVQKLYHLSSLC